MSDAKSVQLFPTLPCPPVTSLQLYSRRLGEHFRDRFCPLVTFFSYADVLSYNVRIALLVLFSLPILTCLCYNRDATP
jgi:hypothetical protein